MPENDLILTDDSRTKLDGIVQQMVSNKESDENIQLVVNDFKNKYGVKKKEPLEIGSEVGGLSTIPVQDLPLAYEESKAGLFDKLAESIQTPQEKSGFRTVQEMGKAKLPSGVTMEKTQSKPIDFDAEDRRIEAEQKEQKEVARLNVKDKYETIKPKLDEFKGIISQQKSDLDAQYNYTRQTLDELKRADQLDINAPDVSELVQNYDRLGKETEEKNKQLKNIENAELFVKDLENIINGKNKKFSEGVYQSTVKRLAFDGIAEIKRNFDLKKISDKIANGEDITADEQLAIASYGLLNEAQSNFQSGIGYDVGSSLVEMVPYLFSFAVTGGISKGIQTGIMSALKSTGEKTTKELAKKGIAYVSGQAVRPAFFSSLYSSGIEKQIGQVETTKDLLPSIAEGTKESPQKAFAKAYANTMAEVMTEQLGEVAVPIFNKIIGKEVKQALNPTIIDKIKDATAFNGFLPEMGEEFANEVLNTAIEGRPAEEIFDPRKILTTALTVGIMSSGFALSNTAYRAAINKKEQESGFKFDTKTKKQIDAIIESDKDTEEKAKELSYIVDEKIKAGAKDDEISNIVQYATSHTAKMKVDEVELEIQKEGEKKKPDVKIPESEVKVSPEGITSLKEEKTTEEPKGKITLTEKVPMSEEEKGSLMLEGENLFTRQINKDGKEFGKITVEEQGDKWKVKDVYVDKEKQGYGKEVYRQMNDMAQAEGKTIVSEVPKKNQSQKATYMWESLVKSGEAIKNEDGSYQMLPPKEVVEFANRIKSGEKMDSPEDLQFYENNKKAIESQLKQSEEPTNAKWILKDQEQVSPGGDAITEGEGKGGPDLQQSEEAGAKAGDEEGRLARVKNIPPKLTHVEGLGMGMNQAEGVYFSTEKKNRYAKEGKPAKEVIVSVRNPIEFDQQKGDFHKVRTNLLNENKDKFTEADFMEYEVPKKKNISVDDLNDAGVEKLAKIVTDHFKKQGYDSIHFTGEGEGELVVFDKKAWKYKDEVSRDIHNAIVSRVKDYNELPNTHKTKKSSALKDINNLVSKAGYSILQKGQGKIQVLKDGKPIKKITKQRTKEELQSHKALNDYENKEFVDFVNKLVDSGSIVGLYNTGINSKDIPKAIDEIKSGIKSAKSNDLLDYLEQSFEKGEISIWDAGSQVRIPISIKDVLNSITEKETIEDEYVEQVEEIGTVDEIEQFVMDFVDGKITDEELQEYKSKWFSGFPYTEEDFENIANNYRNENNAREKERADENEAVDQNIEAERESKERLQESEIESEVAKKEAAKKKIAEGFDDLMSGLGIMQKAVGEKAPDPLKALKQIAEGVYELGAVNIEEFISKITAELKGRIKNQDDFNKISEYMDKNRGELENLYKEKSKKRKFAERLMTDKNVSDEIKEGLSENAKNYIPTSNKVTIHEAEVIIEEKGLDESIHMVRNRKNGIFPRVRVALAETLITKLNTIIEDETLSKQVRDEAKTDALAIAEFITEYGTELGQGVQAYAIWSKLNSSTLIDKIVADIEKSLGRKLTPQEYNELTRLAERAKKAPEGFQKFNATTDLLGYEARIKGIKLADLGMSVWYAHILSGYKTQELNFLANAAQTAMELVRSMVYDPKAAAQLLKGLYDGYSRGLLEAWSVLKTGYSPLKEAKYEFSKVQAQPSTLETYEGFKFAGRKWNPLGLHKYVPRVMIATDTLFFYGLKGMRLRELIHRQTYGAGMSKSEVDNYVSEKLFGSKTAKDFALAKIKKEGLKGLDAKRRLWEIMEQDLPDEIHDDINDFASRGTFNYQPEGRIGKMTDLAAKLAEDIKFGNVKPIKFIIPFTNILSNVANTYLDWSPYGFVRAARGRIGGSQDAGTKYTRKYTPEERAKEYIAASIGTLAGFSLLALANMDDDEGKPMIEISANGTGDFKTNYNLQETGWQKYSVKLGGKWYSYQNTPIAVPLTIIGNIMDAKNYQGKSLSDKDMLEKTEIVMWNSVQYFTDLTFLRGISEFMSSFNEKDPNQATSYFEKYMQNITKGFIVPNIVTQTSRKIQSVYDMPMKEAHGMWEQMYRDIPIARNNLNNMINGLGEEVTPNMNRWVNKEEYDPIWDMIVSNEAWILKPSKNILMYNGNGDSRRLNDEEYYQYAKLRGQILKKEISDNLEYLKGKSKEEIKDFIANASSKSGDQARKELVFGKYSKSRIGRNSEPKDLEPTEISQ